MQTKLIPADIGKWQPYQIFTDNEQIRSQQAAQNFLDLEDSGGQVCFILSKEIFRLNDMASDMEAQIRIKDTETVIEDEIYYTSKIEGANTSRIRTSQLHNGQPIDKNNEFSERMVKNGFDAVKYINLHPGRMSTELIINTWKILTDGACQNTEIKGERFRTGDIYVGDHMGADPQKLEALMDKWIAFYNSDTLNDFPFIKASILHYTFESIHPFCDGNGRIGRLLLNNYLINHGIESAKAVSFSMTIDKSRTAYDAALHDADNIYRDCTPFVEYMETVFVAAYHTALMKQNTLESRKQDMPDEEEDREQ